MNGSVDAPLDVQVGSNVTLVAYADAQARAIVATVTQPNPLTIVTDDNAAAIFEKSKHALLLFGTGPSFQRADGQIVRCEPKGEAFEMEFIPVNWEPVNKRNHPRVPVSVKATLRTINETGVAVRFAALEGVTEDMSMGGALIALDEPIDPGTLVEFQAALGPNEHIRVLAVVAFWHENRGAAGIQFLDYVGSARYTLHTFLCRAA
jgi:hypothetical protein